MLEQFCGLVHVLYILYCTNNDYTIPLIIKHFWLWPVGVFRVFSLLAGFAVQGKE